MSEENFFLTSKSLKSLKNQIHRSGSSQNNDVRHFQNHICKLRRYSLFTSIWYIYYITTHRYFITVETEDSTIFRNPYKSISTVRRYRTPWRLNFQFTSLWNNSGTGLFFRGISFLHMKFLLLPSTLDKRRESPDFRTSRQSARNQGLGYIICDNI